MTLGGRRRSKFFADAAHVTKAAALAAAKAYRDDLAALRGEASRPVPKPLAVLRNGIKSYQIRLPKAGGGTSTTEFSARVHGDYNARRLAIDAYHAAVERAHRQAAQATREAARQSELNRTTRGAAVRREEPVRDLRSPARRRGGGRRDSPGQDGQARARPSERLSYDPPAGVRLTGGAAGAPTPTHCRVQRSR